VNPPLAITPRAVRRSSMKPSSLHCVEFQYRTPKGEFPYEDETLENA